MDISKIGIGERPPQDVNVLIEIPQGGVPVKYELDKASGALRVDRFLNTAMFYPGNYGFIPHTLSGDGDPVDVIVVVPSPVVAGAIVRVRPVGALLMKDEAGDDEKVIAVPVDKLHPFYEGVRSYKDLPSTLTDQIAHFFQHYKDLEKGKWVTIVNWVGTERAEKMIIDGIRRAAGHGDDVAAHFVAKKDPSLTEEDVIEHCRKSLTGYKVPKRIHFLDELPKSNVGKILRRDLRDQLRK